MNTKAIQKVFMDMTDEQLRLIGKFIHSCGCEPLQDLYESLNDDNIQLDYSKEQLDYIGYSIAAISDAILQNVDANDEWKLKVPRDEIVERLIDIDSDAALDDDGVRDIFMHGVTGYIDMSNAEVQALAGKCWCPECDSSNIKDSDELKYTCTDCNHTWQILEDENDENR
jgi:hypothetical protein